ncbi:MAG: FIST C-terminal domain-containing protein [Lentisphaeraceae bacterium]|nr:FIST C-terminal domain-containing protein [Lentisphaeraceae bacterium]
MKWASVFSKKSNFTDNVEEIVQQLKEELSGAPDLLIAFVSQRFSYEVSDFPAFIKKVFPDCLIAGCNSEILMYDDTETDSSPCISVLAAKGIADNCADIAYVDLVDCPGEDDSPATWRKYIGLDKKMNQNFIVFADPFTQHIDELLKGIDYAYDCSVTGGFASGAQFLGETVLFYDDDVKNSGVVILELGANLEIVPIVAQGCRPVGEDLEVTKCDNVVLEEVDNVSPLDYIRGLSGQLSDYDRTLLQQSLFVGVEMDVIKADLIYGDYLIRNIRGIDSDNGSLVVGEYLQKGQSVRFHIRDPQSSKKELEEITEKLAIKLASRKCHGMLVFSCLGRVKEFYKEDSVDVKLIHRINKKAPLAGFFCSGEIGQVSGSTYIHGYTATSILIYEREK